MKKRVVVIISVIALLFGSIAIILTKNALNMNSVNKLDTNTSYTTEQQKSLYGIGDWELNATWTNPLNKENTDITGNFVHVTANTNSMDEINLNYNISLSYTGNTAEMSFIERDAYLALPLDSNAFPFMTVDSIIDYDWEIDKENNEVRAYKVMAGTNERIHFATIGLNTIPNIDNATDSDKVAWEFVDDGRKYEIEIFNHQEIIPEEDYTLEFTVNYSALPSLLVNYENGFANNFAPRVVLAQQNRCFISDVTSTAISEKLEIENIVPVPLNTEDSIVYTEWQNEWGTNPDPTGNYLYAYFEYDASIVGSRQFNNSSYSNNIFTITPESGELVAYGDGNTFTVGDLTSFYTNTTIVKPDNDYNISTYAKIGNEIPTTTDFVRQFIIKYPNTGDEIDTSVKLDISLRPDSNDEPVTASYTWPVHYTPTGGLNDLYPTETYNYIDIRNVSENGVGLINKINNNEESPITLSINPFVSEYSSVDANLLEDDYYATAFNNFAKTSKGRNDYTLELELGSIALSDGTSITQTDDYKITRIDVGNLKSYDYVELVDKIRLRENTDKPQLNLYAKIGNSDWANLGYFRYNGDIIEYVATDERTTSSTSNSVNLPDDTKNVKVVYTGKNAAVLADFNADIVLKPTDAVKQFINSHDEVIINAGTKAIVNGTTEAEDNISTHIYKLDSETEQTLNSTVTKNSTSNIISYEYSITESMDYTDETKLLAQSLRLLQTDSVLNILMPARNTVIQNIVVKDINGNDVPFTTDITYGYNGGDRNLVKISMIPENNVKDEDDTISSGYQISYQIVYPHIENRENGNTVYMDLAYYNPSGLTNGFTNSSNADLNNFTSAEAKNTLATLETASNNSYIYISSTNVVDPVSSDTVSVSNGVYTTTNQEYLEHNTVKMGTKYKYKIGLSYTDPLTELNNVIFYDNLETAHESESYWQGTFNSIDVSALEDMGVTPTIYYSTNPNLVLDPIAGSVNAGSEDYDLSRREIWTEYDESVTDKSTIKAIAVDCGNYEFKNNEKPYIIIEMIASLNSNDKGKKAYNKGTLTYVDLGVNTKYGTSVTELELEELSLELDVQPKTSFEGTTYEKGTESNYVAIDGEIGYLYTLTNNEETPIENVQFETKIEGISSNTLDQIEMQVCPVEASSSTCTSIYKLSEAPDNRVTYTEENGKIIFNISQVWIKEKVMIFIPHYVNISELNSDNYKIESTSSIIRINNKAYKGDDIKTYHKISIPIVEAGHSTQATKTYGIYSSERIYVTKGEKISHMIKVSNSGDVTAHNVLIEEEITNGTVDTTSINSGGVYENNKITWRIDIPAGEFIDLKYDLQIPNEVENNTYFTPRTKLEVTNPYDQTAKLVDENLTYGDIVYRKTSDIIINNSLEGVLANPEKKIKYTVTFEGPSEYAGEYNYSISTIVPAGSYNGTLTIDNTGKGTVEIEEIPTAKINFLEIPQGMTYTITKENNPGYKNIVSGYGIANPTEVETVNFTGILEGEEGERREYNVVNSYSATTSLAPVFKTTYDKELENGMFKIKMHADNDELNPDRTYEALNDTEGNVALEEIVFDNRVGTFKYTISEETGDNIRINYDDNVYTMVVKVIDNQTGVLQKEINYYDSSNKKVDSITFKNTFIKVGLMVSNTHLGDYINPDKAFKYNIRVSGATPDSEYIVTNQDGEEVGKLTTDFAGIGKYVAELRHGEFVVIEELPLNTDYSIEEELDPYYEPGMKGLDGELDEEEETLTYEGTIGLEVTKVMFTNKYETKASFAPKANIELQDKTLENSEFTFRITDVSDGITNGYTEEVTNDVDGNVLFKSIDYTRPGTYQYEIEVLNNNEPNITYDTTKLLLTLVLTDNEDGTMKVEPTYKYVNNLGKFLNVYSETPAEPVENVENQEEAGKANPNTRASSIIIISIIGVLALVFAYFFRKYKVSKLMKN